PLKTKIHHLATNKQKSYCTTVIFEPMFESMGVDLNDDANKIPIEGHSGRHPNAYHRWAWLRLKGEVKIIDDSGAEGEAKASMFRKALAKLGQLLLDNDEGMLDLLQHKK